MGESGAVFYQHGDLRLPVPRGERGVRSGIHAILASDIHDVGFPTEAQRRLCPRVDCEWDQRSWNQGPSCCLSVRGVFWHRDPFDVVRRALLSVWR